MPDLGINLDDLITLGRVAGGGVVFVWALLWLLKRGDALQRENIAQLIRQRDEWRRRAERAEQRERRLEERLLDAGSRVTGEIPIQHPPEEPS